MATAMGDGTSTASERYFMSRGFSAMGVLGFLAPVIVSPLVSWAVGSRGLSFRASVMLATTLGVLLSPLAVAAWRALRRPQLVLEADGLRTFVGRRLVKALPRRDIRSLEVRESRWARTVVAHMQSGVEIVLEPPVDICIPLLRDPAFDQRLARLEQWRRGPGSAF
jgi:hypothetical protein